MQNRVFTTLPVAMIFFLVACNPSAPAAAVDTATPARAQVDPSQSSISPTNQPAVTPKKIFLTGTYFPSLTPVKISSTATLFPTATIFVPPYTTPTPITPLKTGQPITLTDLHLFDDTQGWAVESTGHIVHTTDAGHSWQDVTPSQGLQYNEGGFYALNADSAWATPVCDELCLEDHVMAVWHTMDGGKTWQAGPPLCLKGGCGYEVDMSAQYYVPRSLQFTDAQTGWLLVVVFHIMFQNRYRLYHTSDGGASWDFIIDNMKGPFLYLASGVAFTDEHTGWFGVSQVGGAEDPHPDWYIYKTLDGGHTWDGFDLPVPSPLPDVFALNPYWCGASRVGATPAKTLDLSFYCDVLEKNTQPRYFFHFHNDGGIWRGWQEPGPGDASFIDAVHGWRLSARAGAVGLYDLEQTRDGGLHWAQVKTVGWSGSLDFIDAQTGWAIATNGDTSALVRTLDGGQTWEEIKPVISNP